MAAATAAMADAPGDLHAAENTIEPVLEGAAADEDREGSAGTVGAPAPDDVGDL